MSSSRAAPRHGLVRTVWLAALLALPVAAVLILPAPSLWPPAARTSPTAPLVVDALAPTPLPAADALNPGSSHSCRLYAALGDDLPTDSLTYDLWTAPASLYALSPGNPNGWGIAYYQNPGDIATIARGAPRANNDPNYTSTVTTINSIEPYANIGHIRLGTGWCGGPNVPDPHPFYRTLNGQFWTFAHNGTVSKTTLYPNTGDPNLGLIEPTYYADPNTRPNCSGITEPTCVPCDYSNTVDSELYFMFVMQTIEQHDWDVPSGVAEATRRMLALGDPNMNFLLSDGDRIWAYRKGDTGHTLCYHFIRGYGAAASQPPLAGDPNWVSMSNYQLVDLYTGQYYSSTQTYNFLVDCSLKDPNSSVILRTNGPGQDWYESLGDDPNRLTLNTSNIGGNATRKAALSNFGNAHGAYLTQELSSAQSQFTVVSFDVFVERLENCGNYDRTAHLYVGNNSDGGNPPTATPNERYACLAIYDATPGETGTDLELRARTSSTQPDDNTAMWTSVATGLSYDAWHHVRLVLQVARNLYDVYVDGVLVGSELPKYDGYASTSIGHVTVAAESSARGDFYVDNVWSARDSVGIWGIVTWPGGAPAAGATVSMRSLTRWDSWSAVTDANGYYEFAELPPDSYRMGARGHIGSTTYGRDVCSVSYDGTNQVIMNFPIIKLWPLCQEQ